KGQLRQALQAALVERARAVRDASAALEGRPDCRMQLEALEFVIGTQIGILIVEADDEADGDLPVLQVIEKRPAVGGVVERPAGGVQDKAGPVLRRVDLPQFLQADAVGLRLDAPAQIEALHELLAQIAAAAFGEKGVLAVELD